MKQLGKEFRDKNAFWVADGRWIATRQMSRRLADRSMSVDRQPGKPCSWRRLSTWPEALLCLCILWRYIRRKHVSDNQW